MTIRSVNALSKLYEKGLGVPQDKALAAQWHARSQHSQQTGIGFFNNLYSLRR